MTGTSAEATLRVFVGALERSVKNGTKIRAICDLFCPGGAVGFSPGFQPWETSKEEVRPERAADHVGQMRSEYYRKGMGCLLGTYTICRWPRQSRCKRRAALLAAARVLRHLRHRINARELWEQVKTCRYRVQIVAGQKRAAVGEQT
jgi:hypothetical protein